VSEQPELSDEDAELLRRLLARRRQLEKACTAAADDLMIATLEVCEREGVSRARVAKALGVGTSTVQGWVQRARVTKGD